MSNETGPTEPEASAAAGAPMPPSASGEWQQAYAGQPLPQQRPHFADQVMGMRSVVATALLCVLVGGLGGFALGHAGRGDDDRMMMRGPGMFQQRGAMPNPPGGFGYGQGGLAPRFNGTPQRRFDGTPPQSAVPSPSPTH